MKTKKFKNFKAEPRLVYQTPKAWPLLGKAAKLVGLSIPSNKFIPEVFINGAKNVHLINMERYISNLSVPERIELWIKISDKLGIEMVNNDNSLRIQAREEFSQYSDFMLEYVKTQEDINSVETYDVKESFEEEVKYEVVEDIEVSDKEEMNSVEESSKD